MKKPKGAFKAFFLFVLCIIVLPAAVYAGAKDTLSYKRSGIKTECTVTSVSGIKNKEVTGVYYDENDAPRTVHVSANKRVSAGDVLEGYVLPDKPDEFYVMPSAALIAVFGVLAALLIIGGLCAPIMYIYAVKRYKLLLKKGVCGKAQVAGFSEKTGSVYIAKMRFLTSEGIERTQEFVFEKSIPHAGGEYDIIYYVKPSGKCIADVIEL